MCTFKMLVFIIILKQSIQRCLLQNDNDNCLLKPTAQQVRTAIETLLDFSLFMDTDDVKKISMKLSSLIESELSKNFKQASIKDYFTCNV